MKQSRVGVAVLTLNSKKHLPFCLPPLLNSPLKPRVLVVDSSSIDGTPELAKQMGAEVLHIPKGSFNHGSTREKARLFLKSEIIVMVTHDAYAKDSNTLEKLIEPLVAGRASLAYARQLPKPGADLFESFPRFFNYPSISHTRSSEDLNRYGSYLYFFSDSFGAYLNTALDEIGGFSEALLGEDALACASLIQKGHKAAYVAEAEVFHSHNHTVLQEFQRHFDTGLVRKQHASLLHMAGTDTNRGKAYVLEFFKALRKKSYFHFPKGALHLSAKILGYRLGMSAEHLPIWLKRRLSSQKYYWK